jgi:hypothetical protein
MCHGRFRTITCTAFGVLLLLALVPLSAAQFKVTDNFNRPDGPVGLGWSAWGNGAQISTNQLKTFGQTNVAGGIQRSLDVTFPLIFAFDFSTSDPSLGGWIIGFNDAGPAVVLANDTSEVKLFQYHGSAAVCITFQTSSGPSSQCGSTVNGQRDFTAKARISGVLSSNFSAKITIKYNDGLSPAFVTLRVPAPSGALQQPLGSIFFLGNSSASFGPHFFDNCQLSLTWGGVR